MKLSLTKAYPTRLCQCGTDDIFTPYRSMLSCNMEAKYRIKFESVPAAYEACPEHMASVFADIIKYSVNTITITPL